MLHSNMFFAAQNTLHFFEIMQFIQMILYYGTIVAVVFLFIRYSGRFFRENRKMFLRYAQESGWEFLEKTDPFYLEFKSKYFLVGNETLIHRSVDGCSQYLYDTYDPIAGPSLRLVIEDALPVLPGVQIARKGTGRKQVYTPTGSSFSTGRTGTASKNIPVTNPVEGFEALLDVVSQNSQVHATSLPVSFQDTLISAVHQVGSGSSSLNFESVAFTHEGLTLKMRKKEKKAFTLEQMDTTVSFGKQLANKLRTISAASGIENSAE